MYKKLLTKSLLNLDESISGNYIAEYTYPWEALPQIKNIILSLGATLNLDKFDRISEDIWIAKSAKVAPSAFITGPCIIDEEAEIRHCAFIRGSVLVGKGCVIGNSVELKNSIIFNKAQIPHYNYVGDSLIGYKSHMGAQALTSNVKSDKTFVTISYENQKIETGLKKFGAILGDNVEIGCSSVLNPGTIVGRESNIYPLSFVRGFIEEKSIFKRNSAVKKW